MKEPFDSYDEFDTTVYAVPQSHNVKTVDEVLEEVAIENKEATETKVEDIEKVTKSKSKKGKKVSEPVEMDISAEENVGE